MFIPFSDTSGKSGLVEDTDFLCSTDAVSYPLVDKARNINRHYYSAVISALKSTGRFEFDDTNQTTLPKSLFTLVNAQQDYSLPTDLLKLQAVEIKDSGGNWVRLSEIDNQDLRRSITDFQKTAGMPRYYDTLGGSILLYPAPATASVTLTSGGKLHFSREVSIFVSTDTTKEPGIAEAFHRILSLGAAYDYLVVNGPKDKADDVLGQYEILKKEMEMFYGDRNRDKKTAISPAHRTTDYL